MEAAHGGHPWLVWLPLLPLAGAVANVFFGRRLGDKAGPLACAAVGFSFLLSAAVFLQLRGQAPGGAVRQSVFTWIDSPPLRVEFALQADALSSLMLLVVTGVGFLIHVYSLGYMARDPGLPRYFAYLNLFIFFMLLLVLASDLLLLFVGWEGVGLCSFLLIGFWHQDHANTVAANKAFIVNRIGDLGFLLGILFLFWEMGRQGVWSLDFASLERNAHALSREAVALVTLLLFAGATGKSAQIPLYVWLPDAMQGPTPVSALIHAATMVTAGVYMTARLHFLFALAPATMALIAVIGATTALLAATIAVAQSDIKRVLAYSTVSQLGYMFLAVGVGAFSAAIFHLFTHAFFKAALFLGAGSVIHALGGEQDMRKMGGLKSWLPTTYWTYLAGALAIAGVPLTAGFFSKDAILYLAFSSPAGSPWLWLAGWLTAGLTAFYMFRQFFMVFHGPCKVAESKRAHIHDSPAVMTVPLWILAAGSIFSGWLGTPEFLGGSLWEKWLAPTFGSPIEIGHETAQELLFMALTVGISALGIYLAYRLYARPLPTPLPEPAFYPVLSNKYYVDELYDFVLVRPVTRAAAWLADIFDPKVVDGAVNGLGVGVWKLSQAWRSLQTGHVQHYLFGFLLGALAALGWYALR